MISVTIRYCGNSRKVLFCDECEDDTLHEHDYADNHYKGICYYKCYECGNIVSCMT